MAKIISSTMWAMFLLPIFIRESKAFSDVEALAAGMLSTEEYVLDKALAFLTPELSHEGVLNAAKVHRLVIAINKATKGLNAQTLTMYEDGNRILEEKISTGRERGEKAKSGKEYFSSTPVGFYRPTKIYQDYLSYTWNAPMPNAVFFYGGIALHATSETHYHELGKRASGGCVRLTLEASKLIREKVMETGRGNQPEMFKIVKEEKGRNRIAGNTILVNEIDRLTGKLSYNFVESWDTVIIVYDQE